MAGAGIYTECVIEYFRCIAYYVMTINDRFGAGVKLGPECTFRIFLFKISVARGGTAQHFLFLLSEGFVVFKKSVDDDGLIGFIIVRQCIEPCKEMLIIVAKLNFHYFLGVTKYLVLVFSFVVPN